MASEPIRYGIASTSETEYELHVSCCHSALLRSSDTSRPRGPTLLPAPWKAGRCPAPQPRRMLSQELPRQLVAPYQRDFTCLIAQLSISGCQIWPIVCIRYLETYLVNENRVFNINFDSPVRVYLPKTIGK